MTDRGSDTVFGNHVVDHAAVRSTDAIKQPKSIQAEVYTLYRSIHVKKLWNLIRKSKKDRSSNEVSRSPSPNSRVK